MITTKARKRIINKTIEKINKQHLSIKEALFRTLKTEIIEEQDDTYDLKLYAIALRVSISKSLGGDLLAGQGPLDYKSKILIPKLKKIKGLIIYNVGGIDQVAK